MKQFICTALIAFISQAILPVSIKAQTCNPPTSPQVLSIAANEVNLNWQSPNGLPVDLYQWEMGPVGFIPGTGASIQNGSTPDTFLLATAVPSPLYFNFYVRTQCGVEHSSWSGPLAFHTPPNCGQAFSDNGGLLNDYANNTNESTTICPSSGSGQVVRLSFIAFQTEEQRDFLRLYDGMDANAPLLGELTGAYLAPNLPGAVTATNPSGCLTAVFTSDAQINASGWAAMVDCMAPDSCLDLTTLQVQTVSSHGALVSWVPKAAVESYDWELGYSPYTAGGTAVQTGNSTVPLLQLANLNSNHDFDLYVRSNCGAGGTGNWVKVNFSTPLACGDTLYDSGGPAGDYSSNENYTTTICPDLPYTAVRLDFLNFSTQNNTDLLSIYNGTGPGASLMGNFSGVINNLGPFQASTSSGCLQIHFSSDASTERPGWAAIVNCPIPSTCFQVIGISMANLTAGSATIQWESMFNANSYQYTIGEAPFVPGGTALASGATSGNSVNIPNLNSATEYTLYVRSQCGLSQGLWSDAFSFTTPPSCGDNFYDTGGPNGQYGNNEHYSTVICPQNAGEVVSLDFSSFKSQSGDVLNLYNGQSTDALFFLNSLTGNINNPGVFTSTLLDGCLTAEFTSNAGQTQSGWEASVLCAPPVGCPEVDGLRMGPVGSTSADFFWSEMAGAQGYEWQTVPAGINPLPNGTPIATNFVHVTGLNYVTHYDFYVRAVCGGGGNGAWVKYNFATKVECFTPIGTLQCNLGVTASIFSGDGAWNLNCATPPLPTYGREQVYIFTPPVTKNYLLKVDAGASSLVTYFYKPVDQGCNPDNWHCIDDFNSAGGAVTFGPLVAGKAYFILLDPNNAVQSAIQHFQIANCGPDNDEAAQAIELVVNDPCAGNVHSNTGAATLLGEPNPDTSSADGLVGRWLDPAERTIWFKFKAPPSGTVTITTDSYPQGGNFDTQLALYAAADSSSYASFAYIESDEDNGAVNNGFNAVIYYTGLVPGATYYVQVDGYGASVGTFCIEVLDGVGRTTSEDCFNTFTGLNVNGLAANHWYGIFTTPDILDLGQMVAAIKPGPQNLGNVACKLKVDLDNIPISNGVPYMPAYFQIHPEFEPTSEVEVRLFFYDYELDALKLAAGMPNATAEDLKITRFHSDNEDCTPGNNALGSGTIELITNTTVTHCPGTQTFFLDFKTDTLSEFGAHFGFTPLPVELLNFKGTPQTEGNLLEWTTASEINAAWHVIERSASGSTNWEETGRVPAHGNSSTLQAYHFLDQDPLPQAYYRLRSIDLDGQSSVSKLVYIQRRDAQLHISALVPSPAQSHTSVRFFHNKEEQVAIKVTDSNGRILLEQMEETNIGQNTFDLPLNGLPAGIYIVFLQTDAALSAPFRLVIY